MGKKLTIVLTILLGGLVFGKFYIKGQFKEEVVKVERLESQFFTAKSKEAITTLLLNHPVFCQQFLAINDIKDKVACDKLAAELFAMCQDSGMMALYEETNRQFPNIFHIEQELTQAFRKLKCYFPDIKIPRIYTMITGMQHDLYVSKELIVIGLDFFLGQNEQFRLKHIPQYIAQSYEPASIVCKVMLLYVKQFCKVDKTDKTLLADMVYYGKVLFLVKKLLPHILDHVLLGYTLDQLKEVKRHKTFLWDHFIENELFFDTDYFTKVKYIQSRPFIGEIGPSCPGSIGKWLGWEIVSEYMKKHNPKMVVDLMNCSDSRKIFCDSCYRPKNER